MIEIKKTVTTNVIIEDNIAPIRADSLSLSGSSRIINSFRNKLIAKAIIIKIITLRNKLDKGLFFIRMMI